MLGTEVQKDRVGGRCSWCTETGTTKHKPGEGHRLRPWLQTRAAPIGYGQQLPIIPPLIKIVVLQVVVRAASLCLQGRCQLLPRVIPLACHPRTRAVRPLPSRRARSRAAGQPFGRPLETCLLCLLAILVREGRVQAAQRTALTAACRARSASVSFKRTGDFFRDYATASELLGVLANPGVVQCVRQYGACAGRAQTRTL